MQQTPKFSALRVFRSVTLGHFGIDVFNSMGPVLVAFLRVPLGLSAADVGLAVGLNQFLAGATQPAFGWLTDRVGSRFIGPLSVAWTMGFLCLALSFAEAVGFGGFLALFAVASLGSGAFHPQGTMHAGVAVPGRSATTTSIFFLAGQLGLSLGPALAGVMLDRLGVPGIYVLALAFMPVPVAMWWGMSSRLHNPHPHSAPRVARTAGESAGWQPTALGLLAVIFAARAWIFIGTVAFLPLLFQTKGWSAGAQGMVAGSFWLGGAVAGVVAGRLADHLGRRAVVASSTLLGGCALLLLPRSDGLAAFGLAVLCGALLGAPHSVLMVMAQDLLPLGRALASGLALGFLFAMGALSSWCIGALADRSALELVLQAGVVPALLAVVAAVLLPSSKVASSRSLLGGAPVSPSR